MSKVPQRPAMKHRPEEFFEAPTRKQQALPNEPHAAHTTKKLPKSEIEALLKAEREKSGTRAAITEEVIEKFERAERRACDTQPAPPAENDDDGLPDFKLDLDRHDDDQHSKS